MKDDILKIAVTGSAGSGKSLVCHHFKTLGLVVLDCDIIAREVVEEGTTGFNEIVDLFGEKIVNKNRTLNRARLRHIIINNPELRKKMEGILHPLIVKEMIFQMANTQYKDIKAVVVEVPLLFELSMEHCFDTTVVVAAREMDLVQRICDRDNVNQKDALKILALQMPQKEKLKKADHVILNKGDSSELFKSVKDLFEIIQKKDFLTI